MTEITTPPSGDTTMANGSDAAVPAGAAARRSKLPRLGDSRAGKVERRIEEVDIPERGVSVLLRAPSIGTVVDLQDRLDAKDEVTNRLGLEQVVTMAALMLVEPVWDEDQLRAEVVEWSPSDFEAFSTAVLALAGSGEEVQPAARADFLEPKNR